MNHAFDTSPDRRHTNSIKWTLYPEDVLPLWVADMDFPAPAPIRAAIQHTLERYFADRRTGTFPLHEGHIYHKPR